jgi:hypothetical protein
VGKCIVRGIALRKRSEGRARAPDAEADAGQGDVDEKGNPRCRSFPVLGIWCWPLSSRPHGSNLDSFPTLTPSPTPAPPSAPPRAPTPGCGLAVRALTTMTRAWSARRRRPTPALPSPWPRWRPRCAPRASAAPPSTGHSWRSAAVHAHAFALLMFRVRRRRFEGWLRASAFAFAVGEEGQGQQSHRISCAHFLCRGEGHEGLRMFIQARLCPSHVHPGTSVPLELYACTLPDLGCTQLGATSATLSTFQVAPQNARASVDQQAARISKLCAQQNDEAKVDLHHDALVLWKRRRV